MSQQLRALMVASSYPQSADDWQGLFIRKIADALGERPAVHLSLWAPVAYTRTKNSESYG